MFKEHGGKKMVCLGNLIQQRGRVVFRRAMCRLVKGFVCGDCQAEKGGRESLPEEKKRNAPSLKVMHK